MQAVEVTVEAGHSPSVKGGLLHHGKGELLEAAEHYRKAHFADPQDADALLLLGVIARQTKQHAAAIQLTTRALALRSEAAHMHLNLGLAYFAAGDVDAAETSYRRSLEIDPHSARTWCCLADIAVQRGQEEVAFAQYQRALAIDTRCWSAHLALGHLLCRQERYEAATALYREAIEIAPRQPNLHFAAGSVAAVLGKRSEALAHYRKALELRPNFAEAHLNLGNVLYEEGDFAGAATSYRQAIAANPNYVKAHCNLGNALSSLGHLQEAIACYRRALQLNPDTVAAQHNLGNALMERRDIAGAEACFRKAVELDASCAEHHNSLGNALLQRKNVTQAEECYRKALLLKPDYASAHVNLANALLKLGRTEEMLQHYERGAALDPQSAGAHYNLSLSRLRKGEFREGWKGHEWRWDFKELKLRRRSFTQPQWRGEPLEGRTILLHTEQGLGDTLQFVRYAPMVAGRDGRVILEVRPQLRTLLQSVHSIDQVVVRGHVLPEFDVQCPLMSLPLAFDTVEETIPAEVPYLSVPTDMVAQARNRWPGDGLRVGLIWAGNPQYRSDEARSTKLQTLLPLTSIPGLTFFSLQKGVGWEQLALIGAKAGIVDAGSTFKDFYDTAAMMSTLDLIISVDTSSAHLAGALGLPVWILLPHLACWRWLENREDNPWYPTVRLFRQSVPGDWNEVVVRVSKELQDRS